MREEAARPSANDKAGRGLDARNGPRPGRTSTGVRGRMGGVYVSVRIAADSMVGIAPSLRKSDGLSFGVERSADGAGVQDAHAARRPIVMERSCFTFNLGGP